jgi:iron(III) transport system substrate-binding protein
VTVKFNHYSPLAAKPDAGYRRRCVVAIFLMWYAIKILSLFIGLVAASNVLAATEITVYTAVDETEAQGIGRAFNATHPDIDIRWVRNSVDNIIGRLKVERDQPKADAVWGMPASALVDLAAGGFFQPYAPKGFENLDRRFSDPLTPPRWIGQRVWASALCVNPEALAAEKLEKPVRWGDLLDPAYRERILGLDPRATRTGFMALAGWFALWGDAGGWRYMEGLHRNIATYMHSGNSPCDLVAQGDYLIGISYAYRVAKMKAKGKPIEVIVPGDGVGWDVEAMAIVNGTPYAVAVRQFMDWSVGRDAMSLQSRGFGILSLPTVTPSSRFYSKKIKERLVPMNPAATPGNRERILSEWRIRFGAKSEPGR